MIAAAGSGQRLGAGGPKAFVELAGRPLLAHSLAAVERSRTIGSLVIAAPAGRVAEIEALLGDRAGLSGSVVEGGPSRAESVRIALALVETDIVAIHDAARPLVAPELFDAVVSRLAGDPEAAAAIAAAPVVDTIKRSRRSHRAAARPGAGAAEIAETVPREDLWAAQTPQCFRVATLRSAQERAADEGELERATDEAMLLEPGARVLLEPASPYNLKVTTRADLEAAAALLGAGRRRS